MPVGNSRYWITIPVFLQLIDTDWLSYFLSFRQQFSYYCSLLKAGDKPTGECCLIGNERGPLAFTGQMLKGYYFCFSCDSPVTHEKTS